MTSSELILRQPTDIHRHSPTPASAAEVMHAMAHGGDGVSQFRSQFSNWYPSPCSLLPTVTCGGRVTSSGSSCNRSEVKQPHYFTRLRLHDCASCATLHKDCAGCVTRCASEEELAISYARVQRKIRISNLVWYIEISPTDSCSKQEQSKGGVKEASPLGHQICLNRCKWF